MNRFLPKTLYGRIVLIMIAGIIIAQVLTTVIFSQERARVGLRVAERQFGLQIAEIVRILDHVPIEFRAGIAAASDSPYLHVSYGNAALTKPTEALSDDESAAIIASGLRRHLGAARPLRVFVADAVADALEGEEVPPGPSKTIIVQVGLGDSTWVVFKSSISEPPSFLKSPRFLISMLVRLITVIILSLVAVRLVAEPLRTLAVAAEALGKDIHRPPLKEDGSLEVRRAAAAFNRMQKRLIEYIQERTRILAAVSHDLKTPITRLRLRTELLEDTELKTKFSKDLEEMEAMVSATLDFTRDKAEARRDVDVMALLESLQSDAQELGHEVTITGQAQWPAKADPQSLKRCMANLLDNAWKYGKDVQIEVEDSDRELRISIYDSGPGIPDNELVKVFEPFYRIEGSRSRTTGGTGLGLTIARNAARANGGDVTLENRPSGGLAATLRLPRSS